MRNLAAKNSPDAALILACAEYVAVSVQCRALFEGPTAIEDDDDRADALKPLDKIKNDLIKYISTMRATTEAGYFALAEAADHATEYDGEYDGHAGDLMLVCQLSRLGNRKLVQIERPEMTAAILPPPAAALPFDSETDLIAAAAACDDKDSEQLFAVGERMFVTYPTTLAGLRAKIRIHQMTESAIDPDGRYIQPPVNSLSGSARSIVDAAAHVLAIAA